jgi:hypothetical protein
MAKVVSFLGQVNGKWLKVGAIVHTEPFRCLAWLTLLYRLKNKVELEEKCFTAKV